MIDKETLIKNLEDFKDTKKYTPKQFAEFLSKNPYTADFYKNHVDKFLNYKHRYPRLIVKYAKEHGDYRHLSYSLWENKIFYDIKNNYLDAFYVYDCELKDIDLTNKSKTEIRLAVMTFGEDTVRKDVIDHVIKFCIIPYYENETLGIKITPQEKIILEHIHNGLSVPQIAEKLNISKSTVENHKKNICSKIDDSKIDEYKGKKALAKLHLLAQKFFR